tara:strand:+ start:1942 stop:2715 length:774 start_codon:yes stop_codon:yes gene_type:complete
VVKISKLKISLTNISYTKLKFEKFLDIVKINNLKNIEVAPTLISKNLLKNPNKIKEILKEKKIKIISLQSLFYKSKKINNKKKNITYLTNHMKKIVNFCFYLNIKNISLGSCPSRNLKIDKKELLKFNLILFSKFADIAKKKDVKINIEPISHKYGNLFLNNAYEVLDFIKKIKKNNIKLVLDTGNCKSEKKNFQTIFLDNRKFINHIQISHKHINKFNINSVKKELVFLKKNNFKKTITIEYLSEYGKKIDQLQHI